MCLLLIVLAVFFGLVTWLTGAQLWRMLRARAAGRPAAAPASGGHLAGCR